MDSMQITLTGEGLQLGEPRDVQESISSFVEGETVDTTEVMYITASTISVSVSTDERERRAVDAQFRAELESFAEDWDDPALDVYNEI